MPTVYRTMWSDDGKPRIGTDKNCLGVRVPPHVPADVSPDENGIIGPGEGMSVFHHWRFLPPALIPKHLKAHVEGARGENGLRCFRMGVGPFEVGVMDDGIVLRVGKRMHGILEPSEPTIVEAFQARLAATQEHWILDESP